MPRTATRTRSRLPTITVEPNTEIDCTPLAATVHPIRMKYHSPDYDPKKGSSQQRSGFAIDLYQSTKPAAREHDMERDVILPDVVDLYAYGASPDGTASESMTLECWRVRVPDLERFANALLTMIAKGRAEGIFKS